jgi:hypothetical protein
MLELILEVAGQANQGNQQERSPISVLVAFYSCSIDAQNLYCCQPESCSKGDQSRLMPRRASLQPPRNVLISGFENA